MVRRIFAAIEREIGPPQPIPPPAPQPGDARPLFERQMERLRSSVATQIDRIRKMRGDEQAFYTLLEWHATPVPDYRRHP